MGPPMLEELAAGQVTLATVWLLGVTMGFTACTVSCLPFLGSWVLGRASGSREALQHTIIFLIGRLTSYMLLGAAAAIAGAKLTKAIGEASGNMAIGAACFMMALWLLFMVAHDVKPRLSSPSVITTIRLQRRRPSATLPPFFLGASLALAPCAPLATLLALAAHGKDGWQGAGYGLAFGIGAMMTPLLLISPLCGDFARRLKERQPWLRPWLRVGAAAILILSGLRRLMAS